MAFTLDFGGRYTFEDVRGALADALTALGAPPGPWVPESQEALPDLNGGADAFRGAWRRGEATLVMSAACGDGNPRDGYLYATEVALRSPWLTVTHRGYCHEAQVSGLRLTLDGGVEAFRAARAALAARLPGDASDQEEAAVANLAALDGVDRRLQEQVLAAALAAPRRSDRVRQRLMEWKARLFGEDLGEQLRTCPTQPDAWRRALARVEADPAATVAGLGRAQLAEGLARLAPSEPEGLAHRLAPAWRWLPELGGDGALPAGWWQLDDGENPTWFRHRLPSELANAVLALDGAYAGTLAFRALPDGRRGGLVVRLAWAAGGRPRVHATWSLRQDTTELANVDWLWGEAEDDLVVLVARRAPPLPVAMFLSGRDDFRRAVMAALYDIAPFAWRPAVDPRGAPFATPRPPAQGTRAELAALLAEFDELAATAREAVAVCACAAEVAGRCPHEQAVADALAAREAARRGRLDVRGIHRRVALMAACEVAGHARRRPADLARDLDRARLLLAISRAVVDAPVEIPQPALARPPG